MNRLPPQPGPPEDADERYRRASGLDPSRPSEAVRRAVLAHATRIAADHTHSAGARRLRWRPALFGTVAAAALAGLLFAPRYLAPGAPGVGAETDGPRAAFNAPRHGAAHSAPSAPQSSQSPPDVETHQLANFARRSTSSGAGSAAEAPRVASGSSAARTADAPPARQDRAPEPAASAGELSAREGRTASTTGQLSAFVSAPAAAPAAAPDADPGAALRRAAGAGDVVRLRSLITPRADLDARDPEGRTALMVATLRDQTAAVRMLLEHGANPNIADLHGVTPLAAALSGAHKDSAQALQSYGAR